MLLENGKRAHLIFNSMEIPEQNFIMILNFVITLCLDICLDLVSICVIFVYRSHMVHSDYENYILLHLITSNTEGDIFTL